jgi:hypothetical protein
MSGPVRGRDAETQQCIHCGKLIHRHLRQCPYCREAQAEHRLPAATPRKVPTQGHFRGGLLLMLLSAMVHYFVGGYSPLVLPSGISPPVLTYLVPALFVSGLAMSLWGFFLRLRA